MNEAWSNAPSLQIDAWILKIMTFEEKNDFFLFLKKNGWGMAECPKFRNGYMIFGNLDYFWKDDDDDLDRPMGSVGVPIGTS